MNEQLTKQQQSFLKDFQHLLEKHNAKLLLAADSLDVFVGIDIAGGHILTLHGRYLKGEITAQKISELC